MLFNSISYALFLPIVFFLYWFYAKNHQRKQNILLLISSYFFYSCWDWRFLFLLVFSTLLDYYTGLKMDGASNIKTRKFWFWLSVLINLGFLAVFKYFNFFSDSFALLLNNFGFQVNPWSINVILPVGISFYTFHGLSYVIDIYKGRIKAEKDFIDYSVFVCFFPLLVAGPIERATHLLPQIQRKRFFNATDAIDGLKQILWGLFKKVVIADQCAEFANLIFNDSQNYGGSTLLIGAFFFAFQIYGDFSGYSDIALGTARLFGIDLLRNFAFPYFSRDIAEFWRRWHISLSTWFRDYLYIPLGGSKVGIWTKIRNTFIIFLVSGFWHGANWTFLVWGFLNAVFILPSIIFQTNRVNLEIVAKGKVFPTLKEMFYMLATFTLTMFAWIFFRARDIAHAMDYIGGVFSSTIFDPIEVNATRICIIIVLFILVEWSGREQQYAIAKFGYNKPKYLRYSFYYLIMVSIVLFKGNAQQFIYFQF